MPGWFILGAGGHAGGAWLLARSHGIPSTARSMAVGQFFRFSWCWPALANSATGHGLGGLTTGFIHPGTELRSRGLAISPSSWKRPCSKNTKPGTQPPIRRSARQRSRPATPGPWEPGAFHGRRQRTTGTLALRHAPAHANGAAACRCAFVEPTMCLNRVRVPSRRGPPARRRRRRRASTSP